MSEQKIEITEAIDVARAALNGASEPLHAARGTLVTQRDRLREQVREIDEHIRALDRVLRAFEPPKPKVEKKKQSPRVSDERIESVLAEIRRRPAGVTISKLCATTGLNKTTVGAALEALREQGRARKAGYDTSAQGRAPVIWKLSVSDE